MGTDKGRSGVKTPKSEAKRRAKLSLAGMYPQGLRLISRSINRELDKPESEAVETEDAWKVVHKVDGLPRQQVETNISGDLTLTGQLRGLTEEQLTGLLALLKEQKGA